MEKLTLKDIQFLSDVSKDYGIPVRTLQDRLANLKEGIQYRKLGKRLPTLLTPGAVEKLVQGKNKIVK